MIALVVIQIIYLIILSRTKNSGIIYMLTTYFTIANNDAAVDDMMMMMTVSIKIQFVIVWFEYQISFSVLNMI